MTEQRRRDLTLERREALIHYVNLVAQDVRFRQKGLLARVDGKHDYREYWRRKGDGQPVTASAGRRQRGDSRRVCPAMEAVARGERLGAPPNASPCHASDEGYTPDRYASLRSDNTDNTDMEVRHG